MDPTNPRRRSTPPGIPFHSTRAEQLNDSGHGFDFNLDDFESLLGKPMVTRKGIYRRGFRSSGPEFSESTIPNG